MALNIIQVARPHEEVIFFVQNSSLCTMKAASTCTKSLCDSDDENCEGGSGMRIFWSYPQ